MTILQLQNILSFSLLKTSEHVSISWSSFSMLLLSNVEFRAFSRWTNLFNYYRANFNAIMFSFFMFPSGERMDQSCIIISSNGKALSTPVYAIVYWVRQWHFIAVNCLLIFRFPRTSLFSLTVPRQFLLRNYSCVRCGAGGAFTEKRLHPRPILDRAFSFWNLKDPILSIHGRFWHFLHLQQFLPHHATTNWLGVGLRCTYTETKIVGFQAMSFFIKSIRL